MSIVFKAHSCFYMLSSICKATGKKYNIFQDAFDRTVECIVVQLVQMTCDGLTRPSLITADRCKALQKF